VINANDVIEMTLTAVISISASSGFWVFIQKRFDKRDVQTEMLVGLGHDRIVYLGLTYLERGWVTQAEYENIKDYLYKPYEKMGGNGTARKIICEVDKLPIRPYHQFRNPPCPTQSVTLNGDDVNVD